MVGFGKFLNEASSQHGVAKHSFDYHKMKEELQAIIGGSRQLESVAESDLQQWDQTQDDVESRDDASQSSRPGFALSEVRNAAAMEFIEKLEDELYRVNNIVKQKLRALHRVRKVLDAARAVRGLSSAQEHSIVLMQLSNVYDDVILVLWFMYLNSIAVSKLVKKYNKNMPHHRYTIDASRWLFLRAGLAHAQKAKASIEAEFASCIDSAPGESESLLVERSSEISELTKSMKQLMQEYKHHLFRHGDPTDWAVLPHLTSKSTAQRRHSRTQMAEDVMRIDAPKLKRDYISGAVVGRGAYGVVWKATHVKSGRIMAVKTIFDAWSHPILGQRTYREIQIMQQLSHPNIMPLHDLYISQNQKDVHLVMPFVPHTCEDLLAKRQLLLMHKKWFMLQLLSALAYIHARGVVHRDLKLSNILVDDQPMLYLSDFGLARTLAAGSETTMFDNPDYVQTQWYRAPEVLLCSRTTTPAADMWSTGCILAELLTGVPLFPGQDDQQQLELIIACCPVPKNSRLNEEVRGHLKLGRDEQPPGNSNSSNGDTDTCGASGKEGDSNGSESGAPPAPPAPSQDTQPASSMMLAVPAPAPAPIFLLRQSTDDLMDHMQQVQVTSEAGGLRRGSRNFLPKRRLEDVVLGSWKLGTQEEFPREHVMDMLRRMLQFEPSSRITSAQALTHDWFRADEPLPEASIQEAMRAAVPKCGEDDVLLDLPCTHLHTAAAYRVAVERGPQVSQLRYEQQQRIHCNESAALIQRFWRWRRKGGERPVITVRRRTSLRGSDAFAGRHHNHVYNTGAHSKHHRFGLCPNQRGTAVHSRFSPSSFTNRSTPSVYSRKGKPNRSSWWDCGKTQEVSCGSCVIM